MSAGPRNVLITGGAVRIGRHIALHLAKIGWNVAIHCHRSEKEAQQLAEDIGAMGRRAVVLHGDLASPPEQLAGLVDRAVEALGSLQCLINNASSFSHDSLTSLTSESWDQHMLTNLRAPMFLTQRFVHHLKGEAGHVIHILDQRVQNLTPHYVSYSISKCGLWAFTQMMALALAPHVRVNAIGPGPTLANPFQDAALFERQWSKTPLQRPVDPLDITRAVEFLIDTPSLTGQLITPDGGQHLGWTFPTTPVESRDE